MSESDRPPVPRAEAERAGGAPATAAQILARQDRIPVWTLPGVYLVIIGVGYFFTFFDIADIGYAMPAISTQFGLSSGEATFVALAVGLIGYAAGSMLIGGLSDRYGRFKILLITIGITPRPGHSWTPPRPACSPCRSGGS